MGDENTRKGFRNEKKFLNFINTKRVCNTTPLVWLGFVPNHQKPSTPHDQQSSTQPKKPQKNTKSHQTKTFINKSLTKILLKKREACDLPA